MIGAVLTAVALAMLVSSACAWTACLRFRSVHAFLLCAYLVAWAELVLASLLVSTVDELTRLGLLATFAVWVLLACGFWVHRGRPHPPAVLAGCFRLTAIVVDRVELRLLAAVLVLGYAYLVVLGLLTPQNDSDALIYHLARAALWRQNGQIGVFDSAAEPRLDVNPPVAELGDAVMLILAGSERFVWVVQLSAVLALAVGVFGLARRAEVSVRGAVLSATIVPAIPVVALQAVSGLNDLVLASFVVASAVFVLGCRRVELIPLLLAVALAVGTKFTAPFLLTIVALTGALGQPARRWPALLATGALGTAAGGGWYVVNLVGTGELDGGYDRFSNQEPVRTLDVILANVQFLVLRSIEVPGGDGWGVAVFVFVGLAVVFAGLSNRERRRFGRAVLVAGVLLAATPLVVFAIVNVLGFVFGLGWAAYGNDELANAMRSWRPSTVADGAISWYGPLAAVLGVALVVVVLKRVRRRTMNRVSMALALAPWIAIVIFAIAVSYDPWRGRFLMAAWLMSIALWGAVAIERRWISATVTLISSLTFVMSLIGYFGKPMGVNALSTVDGPSIWRQERWAAQTSINRTPGERFLIRAVEERVPAADAIAVSVSSDKLIFPYFGGELRRTVLLVDSGSRIPSAAAWLAVAPESTPVRCRDAWQVVASHATGWRLYQRVDADRCGAQAAERRRVVESRENV